ncbi:MAG: insulinase family protein [Firmicutes bacterium]|nr:insulinase family protein [Bacillota bacterium]
MTGGFRTFELSGGPKLHVLPTTKFKTVVVKLFFRKALDDETTLSALTPFVLRRGTRSMPTTQALARRLEELYGARLSADVAKIGETQAVETFLEVLAERFAVNGTGSLLEAAVKTLAEVVFEPVLEQGVFKPSYVEQEKEILRRRLEGIINNKRQYAILRCIEEMCQGEPFAIHRYGKVEDLPEITPGNLFDHYGRILSGAPMDLFVMGAVEPEEMEDLFSSTLPTSHPAERAALAPGVTGVPRTGPAGTPRTVEEEQEVNQGVLAMGFRTGVRYPDDEYPALCVQNGILGGFPHSKLFVNVREKASLAYFAYSRLEPTKGVMIVSAGIDPGKYERAVSIIQDQLDALTKGDISDYELEATKKALVSGLRTAEDDPSRVIDSYQTGLVNGRIRPFEEMASDISRVGREEVVEVSKRLRLDTVYFLRPARMPA